jgi:hypothetical protein
LPVPCSRRPFSGLRRRELKSSLPQLSTARSRSSRLSAFCRLGASGDPPVAHPNNQATGTDSCYLIIGTNQIVPGSTAVASNITIGGNTITAGQASIVLAPGISYTRYYPYVPSDAIYGTCTTTADSIYVDTQ